jgi:AcrR family transcriptional regulator
VTTASTTEIQKTFTQRGVVDDRSGAGSLIESSFAIHSVSVKTLCLPKRNLYACRVPKLWDETIESHRRVVQDAILDTVAAIISKGGITAVSMARIAEDTGIGRATLYKYFPDVEAILRAWHERQVTRHLAELSELGASTDDPRARLTAVLEGFAQRMRHDHASHLSTLLHSGEHVARAHHALLDFVRDIIADGAGSVFRDDVPPAELAQYCLHALMAASALPTKAAVPRLVDVTLAGLSKRKGR